MFSSRLFTPVIKFYRLQIPTAQIMTCEFVANIPRVFSSRRSSKMIDMFNFFLRRHFSRKLTSNEYIDVEYKYEYLPYTHTRIPYNSIGSAFMNVFSLINRKNAIEIPNIVYMYLHIHIHIIRENRRYT